MSFSKILIANRGEIAVRVIRTAQQMGYRTVAVYSDVDRDAPHVLQADEAIRLGDAPAAQSYLNGDAILAAARRSGADAIHPGYGFFSENAPFAKACLDAGLIFIGPRPDAIELMGNKSLARVRMIEAGVPCVPGYEGARQEVGFLRDEARRIGYPVMIKAAAGGGGRGMRKVDDPAAFDDALAQARAEAKSAFGSDQVLLERALGNVRHVEIQVFGDSHDHIVHLGERDCSVQRRNQKVLEESPSPAVSAELRARMGATAVAAARSIGYLGAGTIEFLLDSQDHFYFMEMNTRLQVEHPVTEWVTGLDLVEWQLRVAAGEPLPLTQEHIALTGHAMEVRLYAEDAATDFLPQTGRIAAWQPAQGEGVRIDSGICTGQAISSYYDPMLAKIIASGRDRKEALRRLIRALEDTLIMGVVTNRGFLLDILRDEVFTAGGATTTFLQERDVHRQPPPELHRMAISLAAILFACRARRSGTKTGWRSSGELSWPVRLQSAEAEPESVIVTQDGQRFDLRLESGISLQLEVLDGDAPSDVCLNFVEGGHLRRARFAWLGDGRLELDLWGKSWIYRSVSFSNHQADDDGDALLTAPMSGKIVALNVGVGDSVSKGQVMVTLEAMKMFHPLVAQRSGRVERVHVTLNQQVDKATRLVELVGDEFT